MNHSFDSFTAALQLAHSSWQTTLQKGLAAINAQFPDYLSALKQDHYLPTNDRMFNAFSLPVNQVRYVLIGEGPYPRAESATGVSFMDGAVGDIWSDHGFSKPLNRATSLRNFMKMLLVAEKLITPDATQSHVIASLSPQIMKPNSPYIKTLRELQANLMAHGVLLLNAALVFRNHYPPTKEARAWQPFLNTVLHHLAQSPVSPSLILWGKIAEQIGTLPTATQFTQISSEHPYNLSFIQNMDMQKLFGPMHLLLKPMSLNSLVQSSGRWISD